MIELYRPDIDEIERLRLILSSPIEMSDASTASADVVGARFMLSEYGKFMNSQPLRFSQDFGYGREKMEIDLGTDVLPVVHQWDNAKFIARIIESEISNGRQLPINADEVGIAVFTGFIHDIGESTHPKVALAVGESVGDIPYGQKTKHNREVEAKVRSFMYEELFSDVSPRVLERSERLIAHEEDSALHDLMEAAHSIQAFATGALAGLTSRMWQNRISTETVDGLERSEKEIGIMTDLSFQVSKNMQPVMAELAKRYLYAEKIADFYSVDV